MTDHDRLHTVADHRAIYPPVGLVPLVYTEGEPLIVGRAKVTIGDYEPTEMIVMIPEGPYLR